MQDSDRPGRVPIGVVTVSDRVSRGEYEDGEGPESSPP